MNNSARPKTFFEKLKTAFISLVILICFFLGIFSQTIFPDTKFTEIIQSSVGKFFNLADFFANNYTAIIETFTVMLFIWLIYKVITIIMSWFVKIRKRSGTVIHLVLNALKYISLVVAFFLILSAWGVETSTLLASAGIIAIALSFGAQSLIADILAGIFIVFENQFAIGDVIQIGDFRGVVKVIGIRITKFEDINGDIKIINNSEIKGAINSSNLLSKAICHIDISYNQDLKKFENIMKKNLEKIREAIPLIKKGPFYDGIEKFQDSGMTIRVVAWVNEVNRLFVIRQLNKQLRLLFEKEHVEIPYPQIVVHNAPVKRNTTTKKTTKPKTAAAKKTSTTVKATKPKTSTTTKKTTSSKKAAVAK